MTTLRVLAVRLKALVMKSQRDAELDEDIQTHLDLLTDEHVRRGLSLDDARAAARRAFGGVEQMKERYRDQRGLPLLEGLAQDVLYAGRLLRRAPGFTTVAVLSLALGIGATTGAFSVFNAVMLRPLAVAEPHRLVLLQPQRRGEVWFLFNPIFEELRRRQRTLSGLFAVSNAPFLKVTFDNAAAPTYLRGSLVSGNYFSVLGLSPSIGRLLTERDDELAATSRGGGCAAVISHRLWMRRFQGDSAAVGRRLRVGETACTIVGVTPTAFSSHQADYAPDLWLPLRPLTDRKLLESRGMNFFTGVMGRLLPEVEVGQAEAELTALFRQIQAAEPTPPPSAGAPPVRPGDFRIRVVSGAQGLDGIRREHSAQVTLVLAVVGIVLLIAATNVANLLLARGAARLPELATRAALGASRGRLARQLATEGALLAGLGGLLGMALAWLGTRPLVSLMSLSSINAAPDHRVIAVAISATMLAALLAGIIPALRVTRSTLQVGMAREGRTTVGGGQRLTRTLVAAQLALSLLLVTAAGLLLRTLVHLSRIDPGFNPEHVVVLEVRDETPGSSFGTVDTAGQKAKRAARYRTLGDRLNAIPGVRAATLSWLGLFGDQNLWLPLIDADQPGDRPEGRIDYVSARYFETMGMQILRGRGFSDRDREGTERVAVVNEALARERFRGRELLGRRLALGYPDEEHRPFTIVGVVRNSKYNDLREDEIEPMMWVPLAQAPYRISSVALRVEPGTETTIARQAEDVLTSTDSQLMVRKATTLSAQVARRTARQRSLFGLSSGFGALAVLLAAVGLYGTLAYAVSRRTREIGVRLALGAQRQAVLRMILGEALTLIAAALVVGVPLALAVGSILRAYLFGVAPGDLVTLIGACAVLALVALLAALVPARKASRVDPIIALRYE